MMMKESSVIGVMLMKASQVSDIFGYGFIPELHGLILLIDA